MFREVTKSKRKAGKKLKNAAPSPKLTSLRLVRPSVP
jgi:hypothetical protein